MNTSYMFLTVLVVSFGTSMGQTVDEILDKLEKNNSPVTSRSEMVQTVFNVDGSSSESKFINFTGDTGSKALIEYIEPARIKGMKILTLNDGDDIWFYSPRTQRVRKIASHQKNESVNGSDFSYEDLSASDIRKKYTPTLSGEETIDGRSCYKITAIAKSTDNVYSKTKYWVDKERVVILKGEMYNESEKLWKILSLSDVKKEGNYWTPFFIEMKNVEKGTKTVMKTTKVENDITLDDNIFTERGLKR